MKAVGIFDGHLVYFVAIGVYDGYSVSIFPFWYFVPRKIWQPCLRRSIKEEG
jgi:hypothetical protein